MVIQYFGSGGGQCLGLWRVLQVGSPDEPIVWIIHLGDEPQDWSDPWSPPPQGDLPFSGDAAAARHNR